MTVKDYAQITKHPEFEYIVDRLMAGETPTNISQYLRGKYSKPDEGQLRLASSFLEEFRSKYLTQYNFAMKLADEEAAKIDKKVNASLDATKTYKERLSEFKDEAIDINKKIMQFMHLLEARFEQVFDKIQENPSNTKADYVLLKYFEQAKAFIEAYDKIVNKSPERVEHVHSVQIVEQNSAALQSAVVRVLERMQPDLVAVFMDQVRIELGAVKNPNDVYHDENILDTKKKETALLLNKFESLEGKFQEVLDE